MITVLSYQYARSIVNQLYWQLGAYNAFFHSQGEHWTQHREESMQVQRNARNRTKRIESIDEIRKSHGLRSPMHGGI